MLGRIREDRGHVRSSRRLPAGLGTALLSFPGTAPGQSSSHCFASALPGPYLGHPYKLRVAAAALERRHALYELAPAAGKAVQRALECRGAAPVRQCSAGGMQWAHSAVWAAQQSSTTTQGPADPAPEPLRASQIPARNPSVCPSLAPTGGRTSCRRPAARAPRAHSQQSRAAAAPREQGGHGRQRVDACSSGRAGQDSCGPALHRRALRRSVLHPCS